MNGDENKWLLGQEQNIIDLKIYQDDKGMYIQPKSLEDKKDIFYYLPLLTCYAQSTTIDFNIDDLMTFYRLVESSNISFDENNDQHCDHLRQLFHVVFKKMLEDPRNDKEWELLGFQNSRPGSDFRGGGFLSLQSLLYFCNKENEYVNEIVEFSREKSNYLFACVVISSVYFLKNYLHFGVYKSYNKKLDISRTSSRKALKYFISLNYDRSLESRLYVFNELIRAFNKKIFAYWKSSYTANTNIKIVDFKQAEHEIQNIFIERFEYNASRVSLSESNSLEELLDDFSGYHISKVIIPTI